MKGKTIFLFYCVFFIKFLFTRKLEIMHNVFNYNSICEMLLYLLDFKKHRCELHS